MIRSKGEWLKVFRHDEEKDMAAKLLDKLQQLQKNGQPQATDFLDPALQKTAQSILEHTPHVAWRLESGVMGAERARVVLYEESREDEDINSSDYIVHLLLKGSFQAKKPSHRDYLGALLGTGIKREKLGDIWVVEQGCVVAVAQELRAYLEQQSIQVWGVTLETEPILEFQPPDKKHQLVRTTVASLRLDAVATAGYGSSRTVMAREIQGGKLKVNWQEVKRCDYLLKEGDVLSARGRGRLRLASVEGTSKKGRLIVVLERFL